MGIGRRSIIFSIGFISSPNAIQVVPFSWLTAAFSGGGALAPTSD
jgi:hypothetical protein